MSTHSEWIQLTCPHCRASVMHGAPEMLQRVQSLGMLRREQQPAPDLVAELFRASVSRMPCGECGRTGLTLSPVPDDEAWGGERRCEACSQLIPPERVQLLPGVKLCVACQGKRESGAAIGPAEYCPKCGSVLQVKLRSGDGLAGYRQYCPECRR